MLIVLSTRTICCRCPFISNNWRFVLPIWLSCLTVPLGDGLSFLCTKSHTLAGQARRAAWPVSGDAPSCRSSLLLLLTDAFSLPRCASSSFLHLLPWVDSLLSERHLSLHPSWLESFSLDFGYTHLLPPTVLFLLFNFKPPSSALVLSPSLMLIDSPHLWQPPAAVFLPSLSHFLPPPPPIVPLMPSWGVS